MSVIKSFGSLDIIAIIIYVITLLFIGFWVSFRKKNSEDLFLANRSLSWSTVGFSIFGTNVSPSMMIAGAAITYSTGMASANFEWLAIIFLFVLAMIFVPHYMNTKVSTMPEFLELRYSPSCRRFLSWYALASILFVWLGGTLYAGGVLFAQITGWPLWVCLSILVALSAGFTTTGGLAAVAYTDNFNSILMILSSIFLTVLAFIKVGGLNNLIASVPPEHWHLFRSASDNSLPWPAIVLGYPVIGIWFWCTDQTIVQRVLGAKSIHEGQVGLAFTGYLKLLTPFIFFLPGIFCLVLYPNLSNPDTAYMTLVNTVMPAGGLGLVVAVLLAALISTIDGALNSFSTVFTLDIYQKNIRPKADQKEIRIIGQVVTVIMAVVAVFLALFMETLGKDIFNLIQSLISFFAPPMSVVFIVGVLWKKATAKAALYTLIFGSIFSLGIGACSLTNFPSATFWPHYMLLSFYIFVFLLFFMIIFSLLTDHKIDNNQVKTLKDTYSGMHGMKTIWILWIVLAIIFTALYIIFN